MGKLHEKMSADIEFAILSNDATFDPLVTFINSTGRSCIRVKQKDGTYNNANTEEGTPLSRQPRPTLEEEEMVFQTVANNPPPENPPFYQEKQIPTSFSSHFRDTTSASFLPTMDRFPSDNVENFDDFVAEAARETVRRLIRSGNRPSEIGILKNYILLHHRDEKIQQNLAKIVEYLELNNNITTNGTEVIYHF
jgi:hypothetical protein